MRTTEEQKVCTKCNHSLPVEALQCLYCGHDLSREQQPLYKSGQREQGAQQSLENSLYTFYKPSYGESAEVKPEAAAPQAEESASYSFQQAPQPIYPFPENSDEAAPSAEKEKDELFLPFILLTAGLNLILFSLLLAVYGKNGRLTLTWNSSYWAFFLLAALPMVYIGWSRANRSKGD